MDNTRAVITAQDAGLTLDDGVLLGSNAVLTMQTNVHLSSRAISGAGSLTKTGNATLTLNGASTYTGPTTVSAGSLIIGGSAGSSASLSSAVSVNSGALLGGHGAINGNVTLNSGSTLAPGNSIGTLHVNGNVTFNAGSILAIEANPDGSADQLSSTGTVNLGGSTLKVLASGSGDWSPSTTYTIVSANSVSGTFGSLTSNLAFLKPTLAYTSNSVELTLLRNSVSFASVAVSRNQRSLANALESNGSGALSTAISGLSAAQAQAAFDSLSGELHTSTRGALFDDSRYVREAITERLRAAQSGATDDVLHRDADSGLTLWLKGYGSWSEKDGNSNIADLDRDSRGTLLGADLPLNDTWRLGAAIGYGSSDLDISQRDSSADIDSTSLAAYLAGRWSALSLRLGVAHSWNQVDSKREVQVATLRNTLKADYDAETTQVFAELGYALQLGELRLEPFAGLAHVEVDSDDFREHGGIAALSVEGEDDSADYASLGLRAMAPLGDIAGQPLTLQTSLAWQHAFDEPGDESHFGLAGYDGFSVQGAPVAQDSALAQVGLNLQLAPQASLDLGYSGQFGDNNSDHGVRLGLNIAF
ncbi:autotransporter outer membrane beta-barrel domain-containing protein [Pseudomonas sp. BMS12]|uniref:autotransporter outer membrane beta-barrel domain-containing protein n=1 Tax=Pseudomonas sp. BMS12 TaxID=1796033 RepID=UPI00083B427A|nr:autotransporter domain-containing protein [Pseudomonas sp. BMS12]